MSDIEQGTISTDGNTLPPISPTLSADLPASSSPQNTKVSTPDSTQLYLDYKECEDYICNDSKLLQHALSPLRLCMTSSNTAYDDVSMTVRSQLKVLPADNMGNALWWCSQQTLPPQTMIGWYTGLICHQAQHTDNPLPNDSAYSACFGNGYFVDATTYGNYTRFINHSCDPNARMEIVIRKATKQLAIAVFTIKPVSPNSQITIDYNWSMPHDESKKKDNLDCFCGSENCRKKLFFIEEAVFASPYLEQTKRPENSLKDRTYYPGNSLKFFDGDSTKDFRFSISRTVSGQSFAVSAGDFVELYYDTFDKANESSDYNSIVKILAVAKDNRKHAYAWGRYYRYEVANN